MEKSPAEQLHPEGLVACGKLPLENRPGEEFTAMLNPVVWCQGTLYGHSACGALKVLQPTLPYVVGGAVAGATQTGGGGAGQEAVDMKP